VRARRDGIAVADPAHRRVPTVRNFATVPVFALVAVSCRPTDTPSSPPTASIAGAATIPAAATTAGATRAATAPPGRLDKLLARIDALPHQPLAADPRLPSPRAHADAPHLLAHDGAATIEFPLAHTGVVATVSGNIARVEVTQLYQNPTNSRLEAVYAFPLPENAAVTDMMFRIGNRVILSEVRRRQEARDTYERAKATGHTAALTEEERPNLFTQSVANIPPGQSVEVVLRYVHEIKFDDGRYQFVFPTTIGPRYVPSSGVADADKVTPPVVAPGVRSAHRLDLVVALEPAAAFADFGSPSHRVIAAVDADADARLFRLADDDTRPNKDFVLAYRPAGQEPDARLLTARDRGEDYFMLFVQPPADVAAAMVRPKEMVFLLDKSGSMYGQPIETAKKLILTALGKMGPKDTFQLIAFDSSTVNMSAEALPNTPQNIAAAAAWLNSLSGGGGTEMLGGIRAALDLPSDPERLRMVVFCTDGFIGNEREIIDHIDKSRGATRVFGFGIGSSVNRYLIEGVGRAGRGAAEVVRADEPIDDAVARLYKRLDRPVLTDVALAFDGLAVRDLEPRRLPDLFAGQPLVVVGKYTAGAAPGRVTVSGKLGNRPYARTLTLATKTQANPLIGTLWARRRIEELTDGTERALDSDAVGEVVALALYWKLVTPYTSFVAVERALKVDTRIGLAELLVPNELPEGVSYQGIFGDTLDAQAEVTPARVKPGDPEVRVRAPATAQVRVRLPWAQRPLRATWDAPAGEFVARFLVPVGWPDGSWIAHVDIALARGVTEERTVEIHVDTRPAAIAVVAQPERVHPGEAMVLGLKPALPMSTVVDALAHDGVAGLGDALRSATDVKEVLVRAPWGEVARARLSDPFGVYTATLQVPRGVAAGPAELEVVACDTAGNVSRRVVAVVVEPASQRRFAAAALVLLLLGGLGAMRARRRS
jgi:Ca-activated chloride channel family protein